MHTQPRHCPVTAASYFWKPCPQPSMQMPALLLLLPQHPSTLCRPLSPRQPIRTLCERLRQEVKLTAHQSTNNYSLQQDVDKARRGYGCSIYGYLWCNYCLITWKHTAVIWDRLLGKVHAHQGDRKILICIVILCGKTQQWCTQPLNQSFK